MSSLQCQKLLNSIESESRCVRLEKYSAAIATMLHIQTRLRDKLGQEFITLEQCTGGPDSREKKEIENRIKEIQAKLMSDKDMVETEEQLIRFIEAHF